jgi:hypothetical protein
MAAASTGVMTDEVFTILAQIFGAFAQGADGMFIDPGVVLQARDDYAESIGSRTDRWFDEGPLILSLTRAMGKLSAHVALSAGHTTIGVEHYQQARHLIHLNARACPFFHPPA